MNDVNKKPDSDLPYLLVAAGIFSLALAIVDATYSNLSAMSGALKAGVIIGHIAICVLWYVCIKNIDSPNHDIYRKWLFAITIIILAAVLFHRAGFISGKMFNETIEETKQRI